MRKYIPFVWIIATLLFSCPGDPEPDYPRVSLDFTAAIQQGGTITVPDDFAGMCHAGYSNNLDREYGMLDEMGVVWVHRDFTWNTIQNANVKDLPPNQWNWASWDNYVLRAKDEGKKIMGMLLYGADWLHTISSYRSGNPEEWVHVMPNDPPDRIKESTRIVLENEIPYYVNYAVETVKRYNGKNGHPKVDAWLIWNEPDLQPRFWIGTQEQFFALNKATVEAIRALDIEQQTTTTLVGGVFTAPVSDQWINGLFTSGGAADLDGLAYHPYSANPTGSLAWVNQFKQKVAPYGFADKLWLNEVGFPTYPQKVRPPDVDVNARYEGDMPEVAAQTFSLLAAAGARSLTWYHLSDSSDRGHGLIWQKSDAEWVKKGGYWGYALAARHLPGKTYYEMDLSNQSVPNYIRSYYFEGSNGGALIVWNNYPLTGANMTVTLDGKNHKLWNAINGKSSDIGKTSTHTLHPMNSGKRTMLFITWDNE